MFVSMLISALVVQVHLNELEVAGVVERTLLIVKEINTSACAKMEPSTSAGNVFKTTRFIDVCLYGRSRTP